MISSLPFVNDGTLGPGIVEGKATMRRRIIITIVTVSDKEGTVFVGVVEGRLSDDARGLIRAYVAQDESPNRVQFMTGLVPADVLGTFEDGFEMDRNN